MSEREDGMNMAGFSRPEDNCLCGGQPDQEQLKQAARDGLSRVINLRPPSEDHGFDEAAHAEQCGLAYHCLPIAGPDDLTLENVQRLHDLLELAGEEHTLLHCASGNRVGALMALRAAWLHDMSAEQALEVGRRWGLTKMEPTVAALLKD